MLSRRLFALARSVHTIGEKQVKTKSARAYFHRSLYQDAASTSNITVKAKKFVYAKAFEGEPKITDFRLEEEELPVLKEGEILVEAEWLSVDPYMRGRIAMCPIGSTMMGGQVAKVIETKHPKYSSGQYIFCQQGWRTLTVLNPDEKGEFISMTYALPDFKNVSRSLALGSLGMPGNTAYFGFLEVCKPKEGETLVVSGAAGAVGSLVGQIGKIKGLKVIGIAGSSDKCKWLTNELGFDHAINYKTENVSEALKKAAPEGVDCYFDNVAGEISSIVIHQMRKFGRIVCCGSSSIYNIKNEDEYPKVRCPQHQFRMSQLEQKGFVVAEVRDRWMEGIMAMYKWIQEGKIKCEETVTEGFENMPKAFIEMLRGANTGKAVVKA